MSPARFVERFDLATPRFALAIIDLGQIQSVPEAIQKRSTRSGTLSSDAMASLVGALAIRVQPGARNGIAARSGLS
jgi:hypothetical protein